MKPTYETELPEWKLSNQSYTGCFLVNESIFLNNSFIFSLRTALHMPTGDMGCSELPLLEHPVPVLVTLQN